MKIKNIILGIALTVGCSACNDWLTVQPETVILKEDVCSTDAGIRQLLSGMYFTLINVYSPTGHLGGGDCLAEDLASTWTMTSEKTTAYATHDYTSNSQVVEELNITFRTLYNVIAMANDLLDGIEPHKNKLTESVYNIGKGEALAIRALCHLDLIRLWGPMPSRVDVTVKYLPYVTANSSDYYEYITFDRYMELLLEDLNEAESYLELSDPVVTRTFESTETSNADWSYRKSRVNYYGVLGLQARARLWKNDVEGALSYARRVIDATNEDGTSKVRLMNHDDDFPLLQYIGTIRIDEWICGTAYSEHLCGVKTKDFDIALSGWYDRPVLSIYIMGANQISELEALYDNNKKDLRYAKLWQENTNWALGGALRKLRKYERFDMSSTTKSMKNFPICRLSEMYLIVMEKAPLEEANKAWEKFSVSRDLEYVPYTAADREERVYKEWLRELIGEGQNFYTYKRYGVEHMVCGRSDVTPEQYVLPLPEKEFLIN